MALLRAIEVQNRLACSRGMVFKLLKKSEIEGFKVGSEWRIYSNSVESYINRQKNGKKSEIPCHR